jgi:NADH-quinone oxidoreductase subunit J
MSFSLIDGFRDTEFGNLMVQSTAQVSDSIFSTYLFPFEVLSVLLLAALIGAIVIARRD